VVADDPGRRPGEHAPVGERAAHDRTCGDHGVVADPRARQHHDVRTEPAAGSDVHLRLDRPLAPDRRRHVLVGVVLVGDVHVRARVDAIADVDAEMADDVAPPPDRAVRADRDDGIGPELLTGHHARGQGHPLTDERAGSDRDAVLAEHRTGRERDPAALAERGEPPPAARIVGDGAGLARPGPGLLQRLAEHPACSGTLEHRCTVANYDP